MTDTPECLDSVEDCEGKPQGDTVYPKCGVCDRFIRCRKNAKEILCPSERPVLDAIGKCKKRVQRYLRRVRVKSGRNDRKGR